MKNGAIPTPSWLPRRNITGRTTKLTADLLAQLLKLVSQGVPYTVAGQALDISRDTLCQWLKRYPDFADSLVRAKYKAIRGYVEIIRKAAVKDWRAAAWLLERQCPEEFGLRPEVEIVGSRVFVGSLNSQQHELFNRVMSHSPVKAIDVDTTLVEKATARVQDSSTG